MVANAKEALARSKQSETDLMMYQGATETQLRHIFETDVGRVKRATAQVEPCGSRRGFPIWKISEVAPLIVKPQVSEEELVAFLRQSDHLALPNALRKEFWTAMRQKQEYEKAAGDLWHTRDVVEKVGELYKLFRMNLNLLADTVERQTGITPQQRSVIKGLVTATLNDIVGKISEHFSADKTEPVKTEEIDVDGL